jgi:glycosyltransferase involved in cell wall biosynthesis
LSPLDKARLRRIDGAGLEAERADLLVHALAQLPDNVVLELSDQLPDRGWLELLARGYGVLDRVSFGSLRGPSTRLRSPPTMAELIHELSDPSDPPAACRNQDEIFAGHRVAIVTNLPAPYRIPLLSKMSQRLERAGAGFRVFFIGTHTRARPWIGTSSGGDFEYESLSSLKLPLTARYRALPINLRQRLSAFRPTIILAGGFSPLSSTRAARYAKKHHAVFGIWSGEIAWRSTAASRLRRVQRTRLIHRSDFAIAYGFSAGEYLRGLRPDLPLVYGRNSSDAYVMGRRRPSRPKPVQLLAVADMAVPGKGIEVVVDALGARPELPCRLIVAGPHARASGLEERAKGDDRIRFVGALPQKEVRERYAESDVFLFPSTVDVFGIALVEAMGSGLAPVISSRPGAVADLAVEGWNCLLVRSQTPAAWAQALEEVILDHDTRLSLGESAARTIRNRWTIEHASDSMIAGLRLGLLAQKPIAPCV